MTIELYFDLDAQGFLNFRTRDSSDPSLFFVPYQLASMSALLRHRPDLRNNFIHFRDNDLAKEGETWHRQAENDARVGNAFRDLGEILLLHGIGSSPGGKVHPNKVLYESTFSTGLPPQSLGQVRALHFSDLFPDSSVNAFTSTVFSENDLVIREVSIYIPERFRFSPVKRDGDHRSKVEFYKDPWRSFTLEFAVQGPEFWGARGHGQLPQWLEAEHRNDHRWMTVVYRFEMSAERSFFLGESGVVKDYLNWADSAWRALEVKFAWSQASPDTRYLLEFLRERIPKGGE